LSEIPAAIVACLTGVVAAATGFPLALAARRAGVLLGQVDEPGGRKRHAGAVPVTGGTAVLLTFAAGALVAIVAPSRWALLRPHATELGPLLAAAVVLHLMGLVDDHRGLGAWSRLGVQAAVAGGLVALLGLRLLPQWIGSPAGAAVAVLWLVTMINAFNFLDGLDGLSGGVGAICAALFGGVALTLGQPEWAQLAALLCGALIGFLVLNLPPASLFLGDAGSQVVGLLVGFLSLRITYHDAAAALGTPWHAAFTPLVILALPLYDLVTVLVIRGSEGRSLMKADRQHLSHRLQRRGLTPRQTLATIYLSALVTGAAGLVLPRVDAGGALLIALQTTVLLALVALLELAGSRQRC